MSSTQHLYQRAVSGSVEYGHICPLCAGPKTVQALRCRRCMADDQVIHGLARKGVISPNSGSRLSNFHGPGEGVGVSREPAADHPWRSQRRAA